MTTVLSCEDLSGVVHESFEEIIKSVSELSGVWDHGSSG